MEGIIGVLTLNLIAAYIVLAILIIWKRKTIGGAIGSSLGFVCGGVVIIPIAEAIATFVCWAIVIGVALFIIGVALFIIGAIFGG